MKLTWADIEAHKGAVTPLQWKRLREYFHDGKTLSQIGRGEEHHCLKGPTELSIGRACIRIFKSMLEPRTGISEPDTPTLVSQENDRGGPHWESSCVPGESPRVISLGMRVERHTETAHESGRVTNVEGDTATVAWDAGGETSVPLATLSPIALNETSRQHVGLSGP